MSHHHSHHHHRQTLSHTNTCRSPVLSTSQVAQHPVASVAASTLAPAPWPVQLLQRAPPSRHLSGFVAAVDDIHDRDYIILLALRKRCIWHLAVRAAIGADVVAANNPGKSFCLQATAPAMSQGCECIAASAYLHNHHSHPVRNFRHGHRCEQVAHAQRHLTIACSTHFVIMRECRHHHRHHHLLPRPAMQEGTLRRVAKQAAATCLLVHGTQQT